MKAHFFFGPNVKNKKYHDKRFTSSEKKPTSFFNSKQNNTNFFSRDKKHLLNDSTISLGFEGYKRIRISNKKIYVTEDIKNKQDDPYIDVHHETIYPTQSSVKQNYEHIINNNAVTCPHDPNKVVGYVYNVELKRYGSANPNKYKVMYYYTKIYKNQIKYVLSEIIREESDMSNFSDAELDILTKIRYNKIDFENLSFKNEILIRNIILEKAEFSNGYQLTWVKTKVGNNNKTMWYADNFVFDHIAIVRNSRYSCKAIFMNEKKISNQKLICSKSIKTKKFMQDKKEINKKNNKKMENKGKDDKEKKSKKNEPADKMKADIKNKGPDTAGVPKEKGKKEDKKQQANVPYNQDYAEKAFKLKYGVNFNTNIKNTLDKNPDLQKLFMDVGSNINNEFKKEQEKRDKEYAKLHKDFVKGYMVINNIKEEKDLEKNGVYLETESQLKRIATSQSFSNLSTFIVNMIKDVNKKNTEAVKETPGKRKRESKEEGEEEVVGGGEKKRKVDKKEEKSTVKNAIPQLNGEEAMKLFNEQMKIFAREEKDKIGKLLS
jgi:hypothetical protein